MPPRIAVIDDDSAFLGLMRELLSEEGYEPCLFPEGSAAYPRVRALAPAAIILDLRLDRPRAGWEMLARCRRDPALRATPLIVCSADLPALQEGMAELARQRCAVLAKPFVLDDLLTLLRQLVDAGDADQTRGGRTRG